MKIRPAEGELFRAIGRTDGQTDVTNLTVAFRNFATAPKKGKVVPIHAMKALGK